MKRAEEQLREYYRSIQPSEDFQKRLLKLEWKKTPRRWPGIAAAAAACLALGFLGWRILGLKQGSPMLLAESPVWTETPFKSESDPPGVSEESSAQRPTEESAGPESDVTEAPANLEPVPSAEAPTEQPTMQPGQTPVPSTEAPPPETALPPSMISAPTEPVQPPVQPTEPTPNTETWDHEGPDDPTPDGSRNIIGWYTRQGGREYICLEDMDSGETLRYDVTGQLSSGSYTMTVDAFGVTLLIEVYDVYLVSDDPDAVDEVWYDVYVSIQD